MLPGVVNAGCLEEARGALEEPLDVTFSALNQSGRRSLPARKSLLRRLETTAWMHEVEQRRSGCRDGRSDCVDASRSARRQAP